MSYAKWLTLSSLVLNVAVGINSAKALEFARGLAIQDAGLYALTSAQKFDGLGQQGAFVTFRLPWAHTSGRLRLSTGFTVASGALSRGSDTAGFVSLGPTARLTMHSRLSRWFVELGSSPTYLGSSSYGDEDLGGNVHFTSHVSAGGEFKRKKQVSLSARFQHISNAGLNARNPGVNLWGMQWTYRFGG